MQKKILVINLMYIGDLLFASPFLRVLRRRFPAAHIVMLADKKNSLVVENNPNLSELIAIDKKGYHNKLKNYGQLIAAIRSRQFELVLNLHGNERSSAIAALSGAKQAAGFAATGFGVFLRPAVKERTDCHQVEAYLEVLQAIGVTDLAHNGLELFIDAASEGQAAALWQSGFSRSDSARTPVIGLNTGGSWPTKRWTKQGFAQLADRLLDDGLGVAFFGGPMDQEAVQDILTQMQHNGHPNLAVFTGQTSLLEMAALVRRCAALISGDSGPMHIAVSQQVPVIALFGPSNPVRYAPYGDGHIVLRSEQQRCLGCGQHTCVHHSCMQEITVNDVLAALRSVPQLSGRAVEMKY